MKKAFFFLLLLNFSIAYSQKQDEALTIDPEVKQWTNSDRQYLLENLIRSKAELVKETAGLTKEQWNFKETPDRWSINQVIEHISMWEMLISHDISRALADGPKPDLSKTSRPDSVFVTFIMEEKPHISTDYTKPFTYTVPMGINEGKNNLEWFLKLRNEAISHLTTTNDDLRSYNLKPGSPDIHQRYIIIFGHCDRHLRQIRKIKQHSNYPG
ncbi:DinB family protein [Terrimonas alba]|uniref:DinB family protein n=1 Tax=Terrimonas alba TaxID=3349636 RepID=UPI0035F433DB